ncbi:MAG: hypothetical protein IKC83_04645 [Clostridia bacterium]|nr:hypothetical protein [Clostridia bacterium]
MMNKLEVGFGRVNVTPPIGIGLSGYFHLRISDGVLDELEVNALAIRANDKTALLISIDNIGLYDDAIVLLQNEIERRTGVQKAGIFIHSTHTHTCPRPAVKCDSTVEGEGEILDEYNTFLFRKVADSAVLAINDLAPAKMGIGKSRAERVAFLRRYRMKDGTVKTNPGVNNPDIVEPVGVLDDSVNLIRFTREKDDIALVNFANHPDTVGGNKISGDWPTLTRGVVEKAIDNVKCIFFNGAQGDVNHVNVHPVGGDFNDMFNDFDGCSRGYGHALHIARVVAGAVLKVYDKVHYKDVEDIDFIQKPCNVPSNKPTADEMPEARRISELHRQGKDDEIPYKGMMFTTMLADANRKIRLENAPDYFSMDLIAIRIGEVGFVGIPGEPFNAIGIGIKETCGYDMIIPCCLVNGRKGYFPMKNAYDEGGYEACNSNFKAGSAEIIIDAGRELLTKIKK